MVVTNDSELADRVRLLREYGWRQRYISDLPGSNSRLDELQATILRVKLRYLDEENARRHELAQTYSRLLADTDLTLPTCQPEAVHVYHQYVVRTSRRDALQAYLRERGIGTLIHYPRPVHLQPAYVGRLALNGALPHSERVAGQVLSLPMYSELTTEDVRVVAGTIVVWEHDRNP